LKKHIEPHQADQTKIDHTGVEQPISQKVSGQVNGPNQQIEVDNKISYIKTTVSKGKYTAALVFEFEY